MTIPTALALSEIATNKRVEGGGEYYIVSRSFGLNIGATIGLVLYLSQAVSVAFYVIAFTEAFSFLFDFLKDRFDILLPRQVISIPVMLLLAYLIITKGVNMGVKALYVIVGILASNRWVEAAISGVDGTTKTFIIIGYAGAAAALAAIPFSIAARRNRKKAGSMTSVMLKMENASALSGFGIQNCSYPSLGLNINF